MTNNITPERAIEKIREFAAGRVIRLMFFDDTGNLYCEVRDGALYGGRIEVGRLGDRQAYRQVEHLLWLESSERMGNDERKTEMGL